VTSPPNLLQPPASYFELAIQKSPSNPPAAWLWKEKESIIGSELSVRVGGSFVWPPPETTKIKRVVFVAGGVGINPLMSIVSHLEQTKLENGSLGFDVKFLYTTRDLHHKEEILFLERLVGVFETLGSEGKFELFLTRRDKGSTESANEILIVRGTEVNTKRRRIHDTDLLDALGPVEERAGTVSYICGVPTMTDEFVEKAKKAEGMDKVNVLSEKWW
jgi:NAD(P)H-flavin reductase